jgi:hypothetical protein
MLSETWAYKLYFGNNYEGAPVPIVLRLCPDDDDDDRPVAPVGVTLDALVGRTGPFAAIDKYVRYFCAGDTGNVCGHESKICGVWRDGHAFCLSTGYVCECCPVQDDSMTFAFGSTTAFAAEHEWVRAVNYIDDLQEQWRAACTESYRPTPGADDRTAWMAHNRAFPHPWPPRCGDSVGGEEEYKHHIAWATDRLRRGLFPRWTGSAWQWISCRDRIGPAP